MEFPRQVGPRPRQNPVLWLLPLWLHCAELSFHQHWPWRTSRQRLGRCVPHLLQATGSCHYFHSAQTGWSHQASSTGTATTVLTDTDCPSPTVELLAYRKNVPLWHQSFHPQKMAQLWSTWLISFTLFLYPVKFCGFFKYRTGSFCSLHKQLFYDDIRHRTSLTT